MVLLHTIDNLRYLLGLTHGHFSDVEIESLLVESINTFGVTEQLNDGIGDVQITLLGEDFMDILLPKFDDKTDEIGHFLLGIILVILLQLDGILVSVITDFHVLVPFAIRGVVEQNEIVLGDDGKVGECLGLFVGEKSPFSS